MWVMARRVILPLFMACVVLADSSQNDTVSITSRNQPLLIMFPVPVASSVTDYLNVTLAEASVSSLRITWHFTDYEPNGTLEAVFVGYEQSYGKFISNRLDGIVNEFELRHLMTDTDYMVCVEVIEKVNNSVVSHAKCIPLKTIRLIRTDSVLILLFVICYTLGLPLLGCILWRKKASEMSGERIAAVQNRRNYGHDPKVMRWQNIEEHVMLNSKEGDVDALR